MITLVKKIFSIHNMLKPNQKHQELPSSKEVYKTTYNMAWPCALELVLVSLIGSFDTMMVGTVSPIAIAAVGITNQPKFIFLAIISSLNAAVTAVVSRRKGEGDLDAVNSCLKQSLVLSISISTFMGIVAILFAEPILVFAGANSEILYDSVDYFRIVMFGIIFTSISMTINAAQRGIGNTKISMRTNIIANIFNLLFNFLLINGVWIFPRLEVKGAAIATLIGSFASCVISIISVLYKTNILKLDLKSGIKFDKKTMLLFYSIGGSAMVEQLFVRIGFFVYAKIVASLGTVPLATHHIGMSIINFSYCFGEGLGIGSTSLVGQSLGKKRPDLAIIYGKVGQRMAFIISTLLFFIFIFGKDFILSLFSQDPSVIALGSSIMIIIAFSTHAQTSQIVFSGCLRGAGDTRFVALTSLISIFLVRPFITYILCFVFNFGLIGAWIALILDQFTRLFLCMVRFSNGKWTKIQL